MFSPKQHDRRRETKIIKFLSTPICCIMHVARFLKTGFIKFAMD